MYNEQENIQRKSTRSTRSFQYAEVFSSKSWNCRIPTTNKADRNYNTTLISIEMSVIICLYVLFHVLLPERVPCGVCRWWLSLLEYPCYPAHLLVDHSVSPASSGRLDTSLPPSQSAGGRVLPARRPAGMKWNSAPLPRRRLARRGAGRFRSKEGGRRSALSRHTRVSALGVFPSQSAVLLAEPRAPLADSCTAATRLTQKLSATAPFVCWLVSFKKKKKKNGNGRSLVWGASSPC